MTDQQTREMIARLNAQHNALPPVTYTAAERAAAAAQGGCYCDDQDDDDQDEE